jgi:hypothetical protein
MKKVNKRIPKGNIKVQKICQKEIQLAIKAIRGIGIEMTQKVIFSRRKSMQVCNEKDRNISFYSALKVLERRISSYPKSIPYYLDVDMRFFQEALTIDMMLDALRVIVAFHPLKKMRVLAKRAYHSFPKSAYYKPINVPQAA